MLRFVIVLAAATAFLTACDQGPRVDENGNVLRPYWITEDMTGEIQYRQLDAVNAIRQAHGLAALELSPELTAAAKTHAIDMAKQNRPWDFGSDGSSPLDRVARAGFPGKFIGENISETYEDDMQTLQAWMDDPTARGTILSPNARHLGVAWFQEPNGKLWWVQEFGT